MRPVCGLIKWRAKLTEQSGQRVDADQTIHRIAQAVQAGGDCQKILAECQPWLRRRSQMLYYKDRCLFVGECEDDVIHEMSVCVAEKIRRHGLGEGHDETEVRCRLSSFMYYCGKEIKRDRMSQRRSAGGQLNEPDLVPAPTRSSRDSVDQSFLVGSLRRCRRTLTVKQQKLVTHLMQSMSLSEIAADWDDSLQNVSNIFRRAKVKLRACIESHLRELKWTPHSENS